MCVCVCVCTYIELADSSIDGSIQSAVELHGEGVGRLGGVRAYPIDDRLQLLYIVQHHLNTVLNWVLHNLGWGGEGEQLDFS